MAKPNEISETLVECIVLVNGFFRDPAKTALWFKLANPMMGDLTPERFIKLGQGKRLLQIIKTALDETS